MTASQIHTIPSKYPHVEWVDLYNDGTVIECAILKKRPNGDLIFFRLDHLDEIDKQRLGKMVTSKNASRMELWDLMSERQLGNGMNALMYFHQFAKVRTTGGQIIDLSLSRMGAPAQQTTQSVAPPVDVAPEVVTKSAASSNSRSRTNK